MHNQIHTHMRRDCIDDMLISYSRAVENRVYDIRMRLSGVSLMESPVYGYHYIYIYMYVYIYLYIRLTHAGSSVLPTIVGGPASVDLIGHVHICERH